MKSKLLLVLPVALATSGCASIVKSGAQSIMIQSEPEGARFEIVDMKGGATRFSGVTPAMVSLNRGAGYFRPGEYKVTISKDGYQPYEGRLQGTANGWYLGGNLVFGGLIGYLAVDPATGAMWTLQPEVVHAALDSVAPPVASPEATAPAVPPAASSATVGFAAGQAAQLKPGSTLLAQPKPGAAQQPTPGTRLRLVSFMANEHGRWWFAENGTEFGWALEQDLQGVSEDVSQAE